MTGQTIAFLKALLEQTGAAHLSSGNLIMIVIGSAMIYLAIVKHYEPLLLIGIGFACIVANVPGPPDNIPGSHASFFAALSSEGRRPILLCLSRSCKTDNPTPNILRCRGDD